MAWSKAIRLGLAALSGTATGLAAGAIREDEERLELSKGIFKAGVTKAATEQEGIKDTLADIKTENEVVEQVKGTVIDGKLITEAQARALHRAAKRQNKDVFEILNNYTISGEGTVASVEPKTVDIVPSGLGEIEDEGGFMQKGRNKDVADQAASLLRAAGIDVTMTKPQLPKVSGVSISPIEDTNVDYSNEYVLDAEGVPVTQVMAKRVTNKRTNTTTVTYFDKVNGQEYKVKKGEKISSSADAFKQDKPFIDFGPLVTINSEGGAEPMLDASRNIVYGYLMRNGEIRARRAGTISDEVITDALVAGKDWAPSIASGDLNEQKKFEKLPSVVDFSKEAQELRTAKQNNDLLFSRSQRRLDLHKKYGNRMYGPAGTFADFVTGTSKFVDGVVTIVNGLEELSNSDASLNEKIQFLESGGNIQELKSIADQRDTFLDRYIGTAQEISMARVLDAALATVTAYDLAKQTGDTRISNNDFDQYIKTVSGNTAEQTVNLIKQGLESNVGLYTSKHKSFTITKESIPQYLDQKFLSETDRIYNLYDTPRVYENRLKTMFKPFEKKDEVPVIKLDDFDIMPVETDAQGNKIRRVVMKDGRELTLRNPRYFTADKDIIRQAIQKRLEVEAAVQPN